MKRMVLVVALMMLLTCVAVAGADTLEQVVSRGGTNFYVMEGEQFFPIEKIADVSASDFDAYIANHENVRDHIVQIDRSRQFLVFSSDDRNYDASYYLKIYDIRKIVGTWNCYPIMWTSDWRVSKTYMHNDTAPIEVIHEVKGADGTYYPAVIYFDSVSSDVWVTSVWVGRQGDYSTCYMLTSWLDDVELTVSEYVGTRLHEETIKLDALLLQYEPGSDSISCPVVRTRNGYFIIDISKLSIGRYVIDGHVVDILN